MNFAKEIAKIEKKNSIKNAIRRFVFLIKTYLCTHKEVCEETLLLDLGNSESSLLEEIYGKEEATKSHQMAVRRVRCLSCGRVIYQEIVSNSVQSKE